MSFYIGIDVGTSSVKLVLIDEIGKIIHTVKEEYANLSPLPGWREQNPEVWYNHTASGIKNLLANFDRSLVKGIGVTGQMHTAVFLDKHGEVIRPAILWDDTRTSSLVDSLRTEVGKDPDICHLQNIISTGSPAINLLWLRENEPDHFEKIRYVLIVKDYIVYRLTGAISTDYCDASTSALFDFRQKQWSEKMKRLIGLGDVLPPINSSSKIVGCLKKDVAGDLGLGCGAKVVAGTGDNAAAAVSSGSIEIGSSTISLGTSGVIFASCEHANFSTRVKNILFSISEKETVHLFQGVAQAAASCSQWWVEDILRTKNYRSEELKISANKLGKNNAFFFPHLTGDKTVHSDPLIRGAFLGLSIDTSREEMLQAVLEGVAFALKDIVEVLKSINIHIQTARITGGGANSDLWIRIISNVLNISIAKLGPGVGPGYGAGLLALYGCGACDTLLSVVRQNITTEKTIHPEQGLPEQYEKKYAVYKNIYPLIKMISQGS